MPRSDAEDWCLHGPSWLPIDETEVLAFNESEDAVEICFSFSQPIGDPEHIYCFPLATGRYVWGEPPLFVPFDFGWTYLNLNLKLDDPIGDHDFGSDGHIAQSYVFTRHRAQGRYSVGLPAIELSSACLDVNESVNGSIQNGGLTAIPFF